MIADRTNGRNGRLRHYLRVAGGGSIDGGRHEGLQQRYGDSVNIQRTDRFFVGNSAHGFRQQFRG